MSRLKLDTVPTGTAEAESPTHRCACAAGTGVVQQSHRARVESVYRDGQGIRRNDLVSAESQLSCASPDERSLVSRDASRLGLRPANQWATRQSHGDAGQTQPCKSQNVHGRRAPTHPRSNAARLAAGPTPFSIGGTFTGFEVPKAADGYLAGPDLVNYRWAFARGAVNLSRGILEAALRARCASHSENLITLILFWILAIAASSVYQHKRYDTASGMLADHR